MPLSPSQDRERTSQQSTMDEAVLSGDLGRVRELIRSGADVNMPCCMQYEGYESRKGALLHLAIGEGFKDIALALLEEGADVHTKDTGGWTALHWACYKRLEDVVKALIDKGSRLNVRSNQGETPLMAHKRNDVISLHLLRAGASCEGLERSRMRYLLYYAWHKCDLSAIKTLFGSGCTVSTLSTEEQEELLHQACSKDVFVARILLQNGCSVNILTKEEQEELLLHACDEGDVFVARTLLGNGCSVSVLSKEDQNELLLHACGEGDVFFARTLLKNGCSVSVLSVGDQEELLLHACGEGDVFVARTLLKNGCSVSVLSKEDQKELLLQACHEGDAFVIEALLTSGCDVNFVDSNDRTPLMAATEEDHGEAVKTLILAGANLGMQAAVSGNTALHLAASRNRIQCGILLAEGGASVRTKNSSSKTPLDLASVGFRKAIKEALSFTTRKALCIIGNAESGKSTLIAALQAESNSFLGKVFNQFRKVSDCRQRTAGIETVTHCSQRYGEVLFFDFAGQDDYHGPHQMFLESLLSKPGVSMTLLLVVKMTEEEDAILHQLHRWLSPVALMTTPASPPHIIIIGSFLDKVKFKKEATAKLSRCMEATRKDLEGLPLEFVGSSFLNCRQPQSRGIDQICAFLQEIPVPEFRATHMLYSLAWVLYLIRSTITAQAVQLNTFSKWVQINKDNLPRTMPSQEEVCQDLSAAGHALYLPNREDPLKSWLVLDLPSILHDVYGTLFSQCKEIVNKFGLLQRRHLAELFPHLDLEMVQQLLISLEFCLPLDPAILKVDLSELTQSKETSGWLFFPARISAKPPQSTLEGPPQQSVCYLCWQLRTAKKNSISARLLQTILLRLAADFVVKQPNEDGVQQHCCSIWWNGISWQSTKGIDITVCIISNRVIHVMSASIVSADKSCQYLTDVISDILSTVHRLSPKLAAGAYIVHPPRNATSPADIIAPLPKELFPVKGIRNSYSCRDGYSLSLVDSNSDRSNRVAIFDLFGGCNPSLEDIGRIDWPQPEPCQLHASTELNSPLSPTELNPLQPRNEASLNKVHCKMKAMPADSKTTSVARALLDVLSTPDMRDVDELVVTEVAANWQRVALRLGVEGCVSEIILKNHPNDCEGACLDMLSRWLKGERHTGEEERTWSTLLTALGRAGFEELERRLRREHFHKAISP